jgi:hypothetical protein
VKFKRVNAQSGRMGAATKSAKLAQLLRMKRMKRVERRVRPLAQSMLRLSLPYLSFIYAIRERLEEKGVVEPAIWT